jgi:signal transduction histidine kinase
MDEPSSTQPQSSPARFLARHRLLIGVVALCLVCYFTVEYAFVVPFRTVFIEWHPGGTATVVDPLPPQSDVEVGDVLLAIDGLPLRYSDLQFRFGPQAVTHTYELLRGPTRLMVRIDSGQPSLADLGGLLLPGLVALETCLFGFVIILYAQPHDQAAWLVGAVMLGFSVALAAAPAAGAGVPGGRLAYEVLVPLMCAGYIQMAFIPVTWQRQPLPPLGLLYTLAIGLSVLAVIEIFVLNPTVSWVDLVGIRLESVVLASLALTVVASPVIVAIRAFRNPSAYVKRGTIILLTGIGVALLPFVFLTALPDAITGTAWLPLGITLPLLGAIPATYGYVIYRHRYLNLDLFFGRTTMWLVAALVISASYFVGIRSIQALPGAAALTPIFGVMFLFVGFGVVGQANPRLQQAVEVMVSGADRHLEAAQKMLTDELLANPQREALSAILLGQLLDALQVRQAALYLADASGALALVGAVRIDAAPSMQFEEFGILPDVAVQQAIPEAAIFRNVPWARLAVPLRAHGRVGGLLLLGGKAPDGYFDSQEIAFVRQIGAAATIASENAELFELLQDQAEEALRVRASERMQLASRLHDEPLHRMLSMLNAMEQMSSSLPSDSPVIAGLSHQTDELKLLTHEMRDICAGLRPPILNQGLILTLREVVRAAQTNMPETQINLICDEENEPDIADVALDTAYHVTSEALNNVQRHADATEVSVEVTDNSNELIIVITDNGRGTQLTSTSLPELLRGRHFGVVGMHQWAEMAGGRLELMPAEPRGTMVRLTLPTNASSEYIRGRSN